MCDSKDRISTNIPQFQEESDTKETVPVNKLDESRLHYENGKCFYNDPSSGEMLEWNEEKRQWIRNAENSNKNYILKDGCYYYKDKLTDKKFKWNVESNTWVDCSEKDDSSQNNFNIKTIKENMADDDEEEEEEDDDDEDFESKTKQKQIVRQDMSGGIYGTDGDNHTYTDKNDGTVYVWDKEKNAWFPKIDEDFLAQYQMSYGFGQEHSNVQEENSKKEEDKEANECLKENEVKDATEDTSLKRKQPQEPTWFDVGDAHNTKVYVSNLPTDITEEEFIDLMQKCGLVMKDADTGKMKVKLYTESGTNHLKGDALCTYIKVESVELALNLLDGYDFKGRKIHVERAKFTMKGGTYDPSLKPRKKRRKDKDKIKKMQEKLFDWRPDKMRGERSKHERVIIIKNIFEPKIFDSDVGLILEYQQDIREECLKCGDVKKVTIYDRHHEGVAQVIFKEPEAADACVQLLNNRWFGQRRISAEVWDGKTKYKTTETEEQRQERLNKWDEFLKDKEKSDIKNDELQKSSGDKEVNMEGSGSDTRSSAGSDDETDED